MANPHTSDGARPTRSAAWRRSVSSACAAMAASAAAKAWPCWRSRSPHPVHGGDTRTASRRAGVGATFGLVGGAVPVGLRGMPVVQA
jgi:hypothetical protein